MVYIPEKWNINSIRNLKRSISDNCRVRYYKIVMNMNSFVYNSYIYHHCSCNTKRLKLKALFPLSLKINLVHKHGFFHDRSFCRRKID